MHASHGRGLLLTAALAAGCAGCVGSGGAAGVPADDTGSPRDGTGAAAPTEVRVGERVKDFEARVVYTDGEDRVIGVRWVHGDTGLGVVTLRIQSVPQVFLHVNTPPVSDRGEPHTGEHLLLGKGAKGKALAAAEGKSLIGSSAWTSQTDVVYAWNCSAGTETFFASVDRYLDALLLPDYTDEEVRREVCNLGVTRDDATGRLGIEEKGTIYNEMVSSYERRWHVYREVQRRLWGADHPLGMDSGGEPRAVREMQPEHIHAFHRDHYHLSANLGLIAALPATLPERDFLAHLSATVRRMETDPRLARRGKTVHSIPPARPEPDRELRTVRFPETNEESGGVALFCWPPRPHASQRERVLAEVLLSALGNGSSATLYAKLMDSEERELEVDASSLFAWLEVTPIDGAVCIGFDGYPRRNATPEFTQRVADLLYGEFARIGALPAGSEELAMFNDLALVKLAEWEKGLRESLSAPPLFGHRSTGGFWLDHLRLVDRDVGERRDVTLSALFASLRADLTARKNPWTDVVTRLGLLEAPYITVAVPSADEQSARRTSRDGRIRGYETDLRERYGVADTQEAIARFEVEYAAATDELARRDATIPQPRLVADVPLTSDPTLDLREIEIAGVPGFHGVFDNIPFLEVALYLDLHAVPREQWVWLPLIPAALTSVGVVDGDETLAHDDVERRRAQEIYSLSAEFALRPTHNRHELSVRASGIGREEALRAVHWLRLAITSPWLSADNAPRLLDVLRQTSRSVRGTLGGREEAWVRNPANALRHQADGLYLAAQSHHSALLHLARLEWRLMEPPGEHADAVAEFLADLDDIVAADAAATLANLDAWLAPYGDGKEGAGRWIVPIGRRLRELLGDGPAATQSADVETLRGLVRADLAVTPAEATAQLRSLVATLWSTGGVRLVVTGSGANLETARPALEALFASITPGGGPAEYAASAAPGPIDVRSAARDPGALPTSHMGLVHGGTSGVFVHSARAAGLDDFDEESLVDELACRVFGGAGPHGFFMQTWGAGLAYSNGLGTSAQGERVSYYAERCPSLAETMRFVVGLAERAESLEDPRLVEYAVAQAVGYSRASDRFEERTRAAANEIVDGDTPARIARFRAAVLALRDREDLWPRVRARIAATAGRVLPGLGPRSADVEDARFLVIAPESLLAEWEEYLQRTESPQAHVRRIYPRDFWMID